MSTPMFTLVVLTSVLGAGFVYEKSKGSRDRYQEFNPTGKRVLVGRRRLYFLAAGERRPGQPLVVLEAGHGDWSKCWAQVQPEIARFARVVSYDRAGSGWSDPGPAPRTPSRMVCELHDLLEGAGEKGPYLLVGHSMGAPLSRLFYKQYPHEVAGMVWVDSAHERLEHFIPFIKSVLPGMLLSMQIGRLVARLGIIRLAGKRLVLKSYPWVKGEQDQSELLTQVIGPKYFDWLHAETSAFFHPFHWQDGNPSLGSLPIVSIEAQYSKEPPKYYPPRRWREFLAGWRAIQDDVCSRSNCVERIPVQTGHAVMHEAPQVIVDAVRQMTERSER